MVAQIPSPLDLTNCDREPIHIPGAIQPHGLLFALDDVDLRIMQASENTIGLLGMTPRELVGRSIDDIVGPDYVELIHTAASSANIEELNPLSMVIETLRGRLSVDAVLHRSSGELILELELAEDSPSSTFYDFYRSVRGSIGRFDSAQSMRSLCDVGVTEVARLSGFDRVMVYRFDDDWHGEVIAEYRVPALQPFLGLHYPASDIPIQARELFRRNSMRYIADVNYRPSPITPGESSVTGAPLDLSRAVLRSVSPIHIEYLQNMGVGATMTISLLRNGELWGLIACHHRTAKIVRYHVRMACEVIGRTMALHLKSKEENEEIGHRMNVKSVQVDLLGVLSKDADIARSLALAERDLLALVGAEGAAIRYEGKYRLVGRTPPLADVVILMDWLHAKGSETVFVSDSLPCVEPSFEYLAPTACGMLGLSLSSTNTNALAWFRPEVVMTVHWGGDPSKPAEPSESGVRLSPRKSFDRWREIVRLHATPWQSYEIDAARELLGVIGIVERADELQRLNAQLARSNIELDSFAHIASHDLKEPLRGIHNYASDLIEDYHSVIDAAGLQKLETLVRLSQRMDSLIESLLQLSRIGQLEFSGLPTNVRQVVDEVIEMYSPRLAQCGGSVSFVSPMPTVLADRVALSEVFNNLISNAIKYCDGPPRIEIGVDTSSFHPTGCANGAADAGGPEMVTLFVRDNGIGIRAKHLESIFTMFKRLHSADRYGGGTGAGLAIARKIVERNGGRLWAASQFGSGSTLYLTLPVSR